MTESAAGPYNQIGFTSEGKVNQAAYTIYNSSFYTIRAPLKQAKKARYQAAKSGFIQRLNCHC